MTSFMRCQKNQQATRMNQLNHSPTQDIVVYRPPPWALRALGCQAYKPCNNIPRKGDLTNT